jgi:hypothetical protein
MLVLSKIRGRSTEGTQARHRGRQHDPADLSDCIVDTLEVRARPTRHPEVRGRTAGPGGAFRRRIARRVRDLPQPMFDAWITAERRRFRGIQTGCSHRARPATGAAPIDEWLKLAFRPQCARAAARLAGSAGAHRRRRGASRVGRKLFSRRARQRAAAGSGAPARETCHGRAQLEGSRNLTEIRRRSAPDRPRPRAAHSPSCRS